MKKTLLLLALMPLLTALAMPLKWTCNFPDASAQVFQVYQGETVTFAPTFRVNGKAVDLEIEGVYYQTNGMADAWWKLDGNTFGPTNDVGAASYRFFVQAAGEGGKNYRANGTLRMLPSPGFVANSAPAAERILDSENFIAAVKEVEIPADESTVSEMAEYAGIDLPEVGITSIGVVLAVLLGAVATLKLKKADKAELNNFKRTQTTKSSPSISGNALAFIDTITQDIQGVITAKKKSIPDAAPGSKGVVCLYGDDVTVFESAGDWDKDRRLFGEIRSGAYGAASNHALAYTTLGHVRFFYLDPYEDISDTCYLEPCPFCHDICYMPYGAPHAVMFSFYVNTDEPWDPLNSNTENAHEWCGSKKAIVEIDAFDIRDHVQLQFYDNGSGLAVTGLAYGECGKDDWNVITPGVINRFYLEMNYNRLTVIKYAFPQYLFVGGSSAYWSSYYSSYWSSYWSSY